jgi:hypothetical protein
MRVVSGNSYSYGQACRSAPTPPAHAPQPKAGGGREGCQPLVIPQEISNAKERGEGQAGFPRSDRACIVTVGFDRHGSSGALHPPGLDADGWQSPRPQPRMRPWRERAGFEPKARDRQSIGREPPDQIGRLGMQPSLRLTTIPSSSTMQIAVS